MRQQQWLRGGEEHTRSLGPVHLWAFPSGFSDSGWLFPAEMKEVTTSSCPTEGSRLSSLGSTHPSHQQPLAEPSPGCLMLIISWLQPSFPQRKWASWFRAEAQAKLLIKENQQASDPLTPKQCSGLGLPGQVPLPSPIYEDLTLFGPQGKTGGSLRWRELPASGNFCF